MEPNNSPVEPTKLLNDFFLKILSLQKATKAIDISFLDNVKLSVTRHVFTDPFRQTTDTDKESVDHFNELLNTSFTQINWAHKIASDALIQITEENKSKMSKWYLSKIYCQLSVTIFDDICSLLKGYLTNSKAKYLLTVVNDFDRQFRDELVKIDLEKIIKTPTILILHNLRMFRNSITHSAGSVEALGKELQTYNDNLDSNKSDYLDLKFYGPLKKETFGYIIPNNNNDYVFLDHASFLKLLDLYSQLGYVAYLCYCRKFGLEDEIYHL